MTTEDVEIGLCFEPMRAHEDLWFVWRPKEPMLVRRFYFPRGVAEKVLVRHMRLENYDELLAFEVPGTLFTVDGFDIRPPIVVRDEFSFELHAFRDVVEADAMIPNLSGDGHHPAIAVLVGKRWVP